MSYFRSYFEKNNTILKDLRVNTAKNPNTEIFYGLGFSKYIIKIDLEDLKTRIDDGEFVLDANTKHYLHLTNTIFGDEALLGRTNGKGRERTASFDLIIFPIREFWDEGVGFDYEQTYDYSTGEEVYDQRPSNWYNRTALDPWSQEGIYSTTGETIATVHFDNGNEDLHVDITSFINSILTGATPNYGLGVAFAPDYMGVTTDIDQSVAFFSKYTQTFFEPYLETVFDDIINDNRSNFIINAENSLYLYVTKGTNYYDLDELPTVDILNSSGTPIEGLSDLSTTKVRQGVYKVTLTINGTLCDGKRFFYDRWCNLIIEGNTIDCVSQKFVPKPYSASYTLGENPMDNERYAVQFFGVKLNEKIKRGNKRKITVTFRSISQQIPVLWDEVYYRIFIKEGLTQVNVFEWTKLDKTNENSFILDTSYLIPREYNLEIKAKTYGEEIFYKEEIKFEIVSEKNFSQNAVVLTPVITSTPTPTPSSTPYITSSPTPMPTPTPSSTNVNEIPLFTEDGEILFTEGDLIIFF